MRDGSERVMEPAGCSTFRPATSAGWWRPAFRLAAHHGLGGVLAVAGASAPPPPAS